MRLNASTSSLTLASRSERVLVVGALAAVQYLLFIAWWVPGARRSALVFMGIALGQLGFSALRNKHSMGWVRLLASFWVLPSLVLSHGAMAPIAESAHVDLWDKHLAKMDLALFHTYPAVWLESWLPPEANDLLLACYYSYYFWPLSLAVLFYFQAKNDLFERFRLAITLCFLMNFVLYALVPAVGPRFFLHHEFDGPLRGLFLTPWLDSIMRSPPFMRDCFPSGHTGITLVVLAFAYRYQRRFFVVMAPIALGLILATLAGRFHYAIDLIAALPMAWLSVRLADTWCLPTSNALSKQIFSSSRRVY